MNSMRSMNSNKTIKLIKILKYLPHHVYRHKDKVNEQVGLIYSNVPTSYGHLSNCISEVNSFYATGRSRAAKHSALYRAARCDLF